MTLTRRGELVVALACTAIAMTALYWSGMYAESFAVHDPAPITSDH